MFACLAATRHFPLATVFDNSLVSATSTALLLKPSPHTHLRHPQGVGCPIMVNQPFDVSPPRGATVAPGNSAIDSAKSALFIC